MFITFEGGEGAGKSTLIQGLKQKLKAAGHDVVVTREPGGTPLGEAIREELLNGNRRISPKAEMLLFLASRVQHIEEVIKPALQQGKWVLCDRFNDSTIAYQGGARDLGIESVRRFCDLACDSLKPDHTFFLDLDPQTGFSRVQRELDRIEEEGSDFHEKVRRAFHQLAEQEPERIHPVNASQSPENVLEAVWEKLS